MKAEACRVAVVLPAHNEAHGITDLLDTIQAMSRVPDEIIIVDGGSTDGTADCVREWAERTGAPVRLLSEVGRAGPARARNIGIARTSADTIVCIDCGTKPKADYLEHILAPLEAQEADLIGGLVVAAPKQRIERYFAAFYPKKWRQGDPPLRSFGGTAMAFKRSLWETVGGFPEYMPTGEDPEFCEQARQADARVLFVPEARIAWRPRRTVWAFLRQAFTYATTGGMTWLLWGRAANRRIAVKALWLLLLPAGLLWWPLAAVGGAGILAWMIWNDWKTWRHADAPAAALLMPWFALMREIAYVGGTLWGTLKALCGFAPKKEQPTEWPQGREEILGSLPQLNAGHGTPSPSMESGG